jgi:hypothetical protein
MCGGAERFGHTLVKLDVGRKRRAGPPMIASMSGRLYRAMRTTDCGEPPAPTQVLRRADSVFGKTSA